MHRTRRGQAALLLPLLVLGCEGSREELSTGPGAVVVSSIFPIGDLIQRAVGDLARVEVVLPPGVSPASFDVTPRQLRDLQNASLFVTVGGGLDEWIADVAEESGWSGPMVRLTDGLELMAEEEGHGHGHGSGNPHIWLDPVLVRDHVLPVLESSLVEAIPSGANQIRAGFEALTDSLTALDLEIRTLLGPFRERAFIATHAAWTYFAARYGLEEIGVVLPSPGREPSSRDLSGLLELARTRGIRCIFIEPQLGETAARALASELSLPTVLLDPLGGPGLEGREGYFQLLRFDAAQMAAGLEGRAP